MKNSKSETSMIKDIAVFDYVAGKQSEGTAKNFEKLLEQDTELSQEVAFEKQLRSTLEQSNNTLNTEPVSMKNFDVLLERIKRDESSLNEVGVDNLSSASDLGGKVIAAQPWRWQKQFNIAASFAFVAMIGVIGFNHVTEPKFTTLSNLEASSELDFVGLVEQQRLLKLELSEGLASTELAELLGSYKLQSVQLELPGQTVLVSAKQTVDAQQLSLLVADARIANAELVSFGAE